MRVLRALFWIVAVSLLLAGGTGFSSQFGEGPVAGYAGEDSPAYHSAERVVASVRQLDGWCDADGDVRAQICDTAATAGHMMLEAVDAVMIWVMSGEIFASRVDDIMDTPTNDRA